MASSGPTEEVKLGLRNAIRTRRVAQGLEGLPSIETKRPKLEMVSKEPNRYSTYDKLFSLRSYRHFEV